MSAAEDAARSLTQDVERQRGQMELTHESRVLLTAFLRDELRDELRIAVAEGIAAVMNDENAKRFWRMGFEVAQQESKKRLRDAAGDLVLGGVRGLLKWGSMALVLVAFAYYIGGFTLAKTVWAAIAKGG